MRVRAALAAAVLTLLLMPAAASARQVGHVRVALDSAADFSDYQRSANRHGYVILQAWQGDRLRALKRANPWVRVLVYKNLGFANSGASASGRYSTGVSRGEADDNPGWFLRTTDGERFTSGSYGWMWAMDVGNAAYQQRWADNVVAELRDEGWDGVFMDDVNPTLRHHYQVNRVAKYPNDDAYSAATRSALAAISPRVHDAGKLVVANIGSWAGYYSTGVDWLEYLDGAMDEMFLKWGNDPGQGYDPGVWQTQVNEMKATERRGKDFIGVTHSARDDARAARYGYATMLLAGSGRAHFALAHDYTHETWFSEYDYDLGAPGGDATRDDDGVHRRRFRNGLVLVNPTGSSKRVALGGTYSGSGLSHATQAVMPPTSGLVLEGASSGSGSGSAAPPAVLAIVKGRGRVELRWTRGRRGVGSYRVLRNGKVIAITRARRFVDRRARNGRRYRYRVTALNRRGRAVGSSRPARITASRGARRANASRAVRRQVRGSLAARDPRGWRYAFVQRRMRVDGRLRWRRVTRVSRPRSSMRLAIRVPRSAVVRLVVRSVHGTSLRSGAFRAGAR